MLGLAQRSLLSVRSQPIRWITGVHVAKLSIAGLVAADAAQQAAADPLRPLVGLLLRALAVWTAFKESGGVVDGSVSKMTLDAADAVGLPRLTWLRWMKALKGQNKPIGTTPTCAAALRAPALACRAPRH